MDDLFDSITKNTRNILGQHQCNCSSIKSTKVRLLFLQHQATGMQILKFSDIYHSSSTSLMNRKYKIPSLYFLYLQKDQEPILASF